MLSQVWPVVEKLSRDPVPNVRLRCVETAMAIYHKYCSAASHENHDESYLKNQIELIINERLEKDSDSDIVELCARYKTGMN